MKKCTIEEVENILAVSGRQVVDVREPSEFASEHIPGVLSVPLSSLGPASFGALKMDETVYLVCRSGMRACKAAEQMEQMGFKDLRVLEGGLKAWMDAGKKINKVSGGVWNLERQVRFTAGWMVLLGAILAWALHPAWLWLCAFVGAGLVFAGWTDTCGMAMILARMPWNQRREPS